MTREVVDPPATKLYDDGTLPGGWWHEADESGRIICDLCPRECNMKPGDRGFCFVRQNRGGEMVLTTYGRSTGFCIDPIEKKPLNHFLPGSAVLSFGTAGCNLGCKFCQNWDISKSREVERLSELATPEMIAAAAQEHGCRSVAFTYNDPIIWAEYAIETARACRELNIAAVAVTAGYITPAARPTFFHSMDAANVDLKAFTEDFYHKITYSHLEPVLETLRWLKHESDVWFEITNLIIPDANDSDDELREMCDWILESVGDSVPIHFSAFHPDYRMQDRPRTPHGTLLRAREIALRQGLKFAYVGNVDDAKHQSTYCPDCGGLLIERNWYELGAYHLRGNHCGHCNTEIAGNFDEQPGTWGRKRQPVTIANYRNLVQLDASTTAQSQPAVSTPTQTQEQPMATTDAVPQKLELTDEQQRAIHKAACEIVNATVNGRKPKLSNADLAGAANEIAMGAFVTLKRGQQLRGCCGTLGTPQRVIDAIFHAGTRTAKEDVRLPPISPIELRFLTLDVTLLSDFQQVLLQGEERANAVEVGKHGLRIAHGQQGGLLLPSVATENNWDARTFLEQVCRKAQLPANAWLDESTQLLTFEGNMVEGDFNANVLRDGDEAPQFPISEQDIEALQEHARVNVLALATGRTPNYYCTAGDGTVSGVTLRLHFDDDDGAVNFSKMSLRPGIPLQTTLFSVCETAAAWLRSNVRAELASQLKVELVIQSDPALHGTVAKCDVRGVQPTSRVFLVTEGTRSAWVYDPTKSSEELLEATTTAVKSVMPDSATLYSLETRATIDELTHANVPVATEGQAVRSAAVAGAFYPSEAAEVARMAQELLGDSPETKLDCPAVMVPHAGWRYSGRIAGEVFSQVKIPDTVIVISPKHTPHGVEWAVAPHETWEIPGGTVQSDVELARTLSERINGLELDAAAHGREHGIEVELPLLSALNSSARVVGITMGGGNWERCQTFAAGLVEVIREMKSPPLLVVSSDMNHYATDEENRRLDRMALDAIDTLDPRTLYDVVTTNGISMCGVLPCVAVMEAVRRLGRLQQVKRLGYTTSAEVSGDASRVVGYAGLLWQ